MTDRKKVQGEGDYEAARRYRKKTEHHAEEGDVEGAAERAREAVEGAEGPSLRQAEEKGKARAREEDPKLRR